LSETGGDAVTPELALVDPELAEAQRQTTERKAAMSSNPPSNGTFFVDQSEPAPVAPEPALAPAPLAEVPAVPEPVALPTPVAAPAPDTSMLDVPLGTLIFRAGLLAEEQLEDALQEGMRTGKRLGKVLLERGWLHERDLGRLLAGQKGLPFVEVRGSDAEPAALQLLPEDKARLQTALPLRYEHGQLVVAVADPSNELVLENLRRALGTEPQLVVAAQGDLIRAIGEAYAPTPAAAPAPPAAAPTPEPALDAQPPPGLQVQPPPSLQVEPVQAPASVEIPPLVEETLPAQGLAAPAPMPTVLPPAEERVAEPEAAVLQAPLPEPAAPAMEEQPAVAQPAVAEETEAPLPESPPLQPEPVASTEPTSLLEAAPPAPEPTPASAPLQAPVESFEVPPPVAAPPAQEPEQQVAQPAPVVEQPVEAPPAAPAAPQFEVPSQSVSAQGEPTPAVMHVVLIHMREGNMLEVGTFRTATEAAARAQEVVQQIAAAEDEDTWPFFAERYLRPDTIVSVDLLEEQADKWLGSPFRARWAEQS
jgi:hypothetical protein